MPTSLHAEVCYVFKLAGFTDKNTSNTKVVNKQNLKSKKRPTNVGLKHQTLARMLAVRGKVITGLMKEIS